MKYLSLVLGKIRNISLSSAEFAQRLVKVKEFLIEQLSIWSDTGCSGRGV